MTQIKQHTLQSGERILLVSVPPCIHLQHEVTIHEPIQNFIHYYTGIEDDLGHYHNLEAHDIELPQGNWQLIVLSDEITEEHAAAIVDISFNSPRMYKDYIDNLPGFTAIESFKSFMQSLGCEGRYAVLREVR